MGSIVWHIRELQDNSTCSAMQYTLLKFHVMSNHVMANHVMSCHVFVEWEAIILRTTNFSYQLTLCYYYVYCIVLSSRIRNASGCFVGETVFCSIQFNSIQSNASLSSLSTVSFYFYFSFDILLFYKSSYSPYYYYYYYVAFSFLLFCFLSLFLFPVIIIITIISSTIDMN